MAIIPTMSCKFDSAVLPWADIAPVFLDMDDTLLDLHFDNHFWQEHVPLRYAQKHRLSVDQAKQQLFPRFEALVGTIDWYCIDHWSRELGLDIGALKSQLTHLIKVHPHVANFLQALRNVDKRVVLVTNAHHKVIDLKMGVTGLAHHFDAVICAHSLRIPKEDPRFWPSLADRDPFDRDRTLFVDDSLPVLHSARDYGIRHLRAVRLPDSKAPAKPTGDFTAIGSFDELMAGLNRRPSPPAANKAFDPSV